MSSSYIDEYLLDSWISLSKEKKVSSYLARHPVCRTLKAHYTSPPGRPVNSEMYGSLLYV